MSVRSRQPATGKMPKAAATNLDLAVALFEKGFAADRVEAAVGQCATIEEALRWLKQPKNGETKSGAKPPTPAAKAGVAAAAPGADVQKRRILRKKTSSEMPVPKVSSAEAAAPVSSPAAVAARTDAEALRSPGSALEPTSSRVGSTRAGSADTRQDSTTSTDTSSKVSRAGSAEHVPSRQAIAGLSPPEFTPAAAQEFPSAVAGRPIPLVAGDGSVWWQDAAARWPSIVADLRSKLPAGQGISCAVEDAVSSSQGRSLESTPKRQRTSQNEAPRKPALVEEPNASASVSALPALQQATISSSTGSRPAASSSVASSSAQADAGVGSATASTATPGRTHGSAAADIAVASVATPGKQVISPSGARRSSPRPVASVTRGRRSSTPGSAMKLNSTVDMCSICCHDIPANQAVRLDCGHGWYCAQCVFRHAEARLSMGAASVTCPECNVNLAERVLRKLLPEEVIDRLHARSLEQAVSSAADLWACPTPNCPMRVALEENEVPRLKCFHCKRESCLRCGAQPYHKGASCEEHAKRVRMRTLAKGSKKSQQERERLEGEESLMKWIRETGAKQCPTCKMAVTKQNLTNQATQYSECHKMMCRNCNTKFCFKCLAVLTESYTCGCTRVDHGFVDPKTGKRIEHLRLGSAKAKAKRKAGQ